MRTSRALNWENKKKLSCFIQQVHQSNKDTSCFLFTVRAIQAFLAQEKPRLHFWFQSILCSSVEKLKIKSMFDSTIEFWLMNCIYIVLLFISACTNTMSDTQCQEWSNNRRCSIYFVVQFCRKTCRNCY